MVPPQSIPASIVIPTRARPSYLEVALASIAPQSAAAAAEVLVIDDAGASAQVRALAERYGARYVPHERPLGLNVARNTGVACSTGALVVFVDDDIEADASWLAALLSAAEEHPDIEVFTGPVRPRLEGGPPRGCGREQPPITALELGDEDTVTRYAWGANMAIRRRALERVGAFDVTLHDGGDEQEWQDRLRAQTPGARVLYAAAAGVDHRRTGDDARLTSLIRVAHARGRAARRLNASRGEAPPLRAELRTLAGCTWHVARRRCLIGLTMVAHSAGRVRESLYESLRTRPPGPMSNNIASGPLNAVTHPQACDNGPARTDAPTNEPNGSTGSRGSEHHAGDDFLSGASGTVGGVDAIVRGLRDEAADAWEIAGGRRLRLQRAARREPPRRRVLVLGVVRPERRELAEGIRTELLRSRHEVELHTRPPGSEGKFENLNRLLAEHPADGHDWLLLVDDDIELPRGFLDRLLFLCERFSLQLAQPAQRLRSHAAWAQTRRHPRSVMRETCFVEIGPVTVFASATFATLLPFPQLRMGWGLDAHWAAVARAQGWRCGVLDAVAIGHRVAPAGDGYSRADAIAEARAFLAERPYLSAAEAQRTLTTHRRW